MRYRSTNEKTEIVGGITSVMCNGDGGRSVIYIAVSNGRRMKPGECPVRATYRLDTSPDSRRGSARYVRAGITSYTTVA